MSDSANTSEPNPPSPLFSSPHSEKAGGTPPVVWLIAGLVVAVAVGGMMLAARHNRDTQPTLLNQPLPPDPYAASLAISGIQMSTASNFAGSQLTYVDGRIRNIGARTLMGATVQVIFSNDMNYPPQVETTPLVFIRTHDPYVDTEPVSAAPLKPGDEQEFRLIFERIATDWNGQYPEVRVVKAQF